MTHCTTAPSPSTPTPLVTHYICSCLPLRQVLGQIETQVREECRPARTRAAAAEGGSSDEREALAVGS